METSIPIEGGTERSAIEPVPVTERHRGAPELAAERPVMAGERP